MESNSNSNYTADFSRRTRSRARLHWEEDENTIYRVLIENSNNTQHFIDSTSAQMLELRRQGNHFHMDREHSDAPIDGNYMFTDMYRLHGVPILDNFYNVIDTVQFADIVDPSNEDEELIARAELHEEHEDRVNEFEFAINRRPLENPDHANAQVSEFESDAEQSELNAVPQNQSLIKDKFEFGVNDFEEEFGEQITNGINFLKTSNSRKGMRIYRQNMMKVLNGVEDCVRKLKKRVKKSYKSKLNNLRLTCLENNKVKFVRPKFFFFEDEVVNAENTKVNPKVFGNLMEQNDLISSYSD